LAHATTRDARHRQTSDVQLWRPLGRPRRPEAARFTLGRRHCGGKMWSGDGNIDVAAGPDNVAEKESGLVPPERQGSGSLPEARDRRPVRSDEKPALQGTSSGAGTSSGWQKAWLDEAVPGKLRNSTANWFESAKLRCRVSFCQPLTSLRTADLALSPLVVLNGQPARARTPTWRPRQSVEDRLNPHFGTATVHSSTASGQRFCAVTSEARPGRSTHGDERRTSPIKWHALDHGRRRRLWEDGHHPSPAPWCPLARPRSRTV